MTTPFDFPSVKSPSFPTDHAARREPSLARATQKSKAEPAEASSNALTAGLAASVAEQPIIGDDGNNTLNGGGADDFLDGLRGNDTLYGQEGNDTLADGWAGDDEGVDSLFGGGGNDTVIVHFANGANVYDGGEGEDTLDLSGDSRGYAQIVLGTTFTQFGATFTSFEHVFGSAGNDRIEGSASANFIFGNSGNDIINGNGGDDDIVGGAGSDIIHGNDGNDVLYDNYTVPGASSALYGDAGNDIIVAFGPVAGDLFDGGTGVDWIDLSPDLRGYSGANSIDLSGSTFFAYGATFQYFENAYGSQGDDVIKGSSATNLLVGGGGDDVIDGGAGNDTIYGGDGNDEFFDLDTVGDAIYGEAGDDVFHVSNGSGSFFDGGTGHNTLDASRWFSGIGSPGTIHLDGSQDNFDFFTLGNSRFRNFSNALGTVYNDSIKGHGLLNIIDGGAGVDSIAGIGNGTQIITDQDAEFDYINGGAGADRIIVVGAANGRCDGSYDVDMLDLSQATAGFSGASAILLDGRTFINGAGTFKGFEGVVGTSFVDEILGSAVSNDIDGGGGADVVLAGGGDDTLRDGDDAADFLRGGDGDDVFLVSKASDGDIYDAGAGDGDVLDLSESQTGFGATRQLDLTGQGAASFIGFERVIGTSFADRIVGATTSETIRSGAGDDQVFGNDGDDVLEGGLGADMLDGGAGNDTASYEHAAGGVTAKLANASQNLGEAHGDTYVSIANLIGSAHADMLVGNAVANVLTGGLGADRLRGGLGGDRFVFGSAAQSGSGAGHDVIEDWEASDRVDLDAIDTDAALVGVQGFAWAGLGVADGTLLQGQLKYYQQGGNTFVVGSIDADGLTDFQIELSGLHALTAENVVGLGRAGTSGADALIGSAGSQTFTFAVPHLTSEDVVAGGAGADILTLTGGGNLDAARLAGVSGIETISLSNGGISLTLNDTVAGANGADLTVLTSGGDDVVDASAVTAVGRALRLTAGTGNDVFRGGAGADVFTFAAAGLTAADVVSGGNGPAIDTLVLTSHGQLDLSGVSGIERIVLADAPPTPLVLGDGNTLTITDALLSNASGGILTIVGGIGDNTVDASGVIGAEHGIDVTGGRGHDRFIGGAGSDVFRFSIEEYNGTISNDQYDTIDGGGGALDELVFTDAGYIGRYQFGFPDGSHLGRTTGIERIRLADGDNTIVYSFGLASPDRILEIYGGNGVDRILTEEDTGGIIYGPPVELRGFGGNDTLGGGNWDDNLYGGDGDDTLTGHGGRDRLEGGAGLDTYRFSRTYWGQDTINNYAEDHGIVGPDVLSFGYGISSTDLVVGRQGADLIISRIGSADQITVSGYGNGSDYQGLMLRFADGSVWTADDLRFMGGFAASATNQADELVGGADSDDINGLQGNDTLLGNGGDDILEGGEGSDVIDGGAGSDTAAYRLAAAGADGKGLTIDLANPGNNTGEAAGDTYLSIENVIGSAFDDRLIGDGSANLLDGGLGVDRMYGGLGDDIYVVSQTGDKAIELEKQGTDTVLSAISYSLSGQFIENLTLTGTDNITATGNSLNNVLTGNSGNNTLAGGTGVDTADWAAATSALTITVDANGDGTVTGAGIGTDIFTGIENVIGGSSGDIITGNARSNRIDGGLGYDQMSGGAGNDTYVVDQVGDKVIELNSEGTDTVLSSISFSLVGQYVENLTLTGSANTNATGNSLNNMLTGNAGNNALAGGTGTDTANWAAATSALTIVLDANGNGAVSGTGIGTDTFSSIENVVGGMQGDTITGNARANRLEGGLGDDYIDGGAGVDALFGGLGDDTFIVDDTSDEVFETQGEGTDTVRSSVSFNLSGKYIENLRLTGNAAVNATGNSLDNVLSGNGANNALDGGNGNDTADFSAATSALTIILDANGSGNVTGAGIGSDTFSSIENVIGGSASDTITGNAASNRIDGGLGADKMYGGRGNDSYVVNDSGDKVFELSGEGNDTVFASVSFSAAGQYIENVTLTGVATINATGSSLNNVLTGNGASNSLFGGSGADTFVFNTALNGTSNVDTITDFNATADTIRLDRAIFGAFAAVGGIGQDQFQDLALGAAGAQDRILYNSTTGDLFYDSDGSGEDAAIRFANLSNHPAISYGDFFIV